MILFQTEEYEEHTGVQKGFILIPPVLKTLSPGA